MACGGTFLVTVCQHQAAVSRATPTRPGKAQPALLSQPALEAPCGCGLELPGRPLRGWTAAGLPALVPAGLMRPRAEGQRGARARWANPHEQVPAARQEPTFRRCTVLGTRPHGLGPGSRRPFQRSRWGLPSIHPSIPHGHLLPPLTAPAPWRLAQLKAANQETLARSLGLLWGQGPLWGPREASGPHGLTSVARSVIRSLNPWTTPVSNPHRLSSPDGEFRWSSVCRTWDACQGRGLWVGGSLCVRWTLQGSAASVRQVAAAGKATSATAMPGSDPSLSAVPERGRLLPPDFSWPGARSRFTC